MNLQYFGQREFEKARQIFEALSKGNYNSNDFFIDDTADIHCDTTTGEVYLQNDYDEYLKCVIKDGEFQLEKYWYIDDRLMDLDEMCEYYQDNYDDIDDWVREMIYEAWEERQDKTTYILKHYDED